MKIETRTPAERLADDQEIRCGVVRCSNCGEVTGTAFTLEGGDVAMGFCQRCSEAAISNPRRTDGR